MKTLASAVKIFKHFIDIRHRYLLTNNSLICFTHVHVQPDALGFFTGLTLKVGPSTRSYIHVAMRSSNFAVTFYVSANWTRLGF